MSATKRAATKKAPEAEPGWRNRIVGQGSKPASDFLANPMNWRLHGEQQRKAVHTSLERVGWVQQVIENATTGHLVDGHERVWQALQNNDAAVPYIQVELTEDEERFVLATLDPIGALADTDAEALKKLAGDDIDLSQFWHEDELAALLGDEGGSGGADPGPQIDRAGELQEKWQVKTGDLWQIGRHRLLCGDSTRAEDVARVMGDERANLIFTSPPYNRGSTFGGGFPDRGGMWQGAELARGYASYTGDLPKEKYYEWQSKLLQLWWELLSDAGAIFYNHRPRVQDGILETPLDWNPGLPIRQIVIWHSGAGVNFAPTHYCPSCEWIVIFAKPDFRLTDKSVSGIGDVWQFGTNSDPSHPAPFPVDLPKTAIETTGSKIILDPFLGSGTTLVACEQTGRIGRGIEIEPKYCAVTLERLATMGLEAKRING